MSLNEWLANPRIEVLVTDSAEVKALRERCNALEDEVLRLQALYGKECNYNMMLQDCLKHHGIERP